MIAITKDSLEPVIERLEHYATNVKWTNVQAAQDMLIAVDAMRIALASLEAEAVAYIFKHPAGRLFWALTDESNKGQSDVMPVYTAPPAPVTINAEPVAWLWSHRKHPSEVTLVRPEDDEMAEGSVWSGWSCQALYAAQPAPVSVPDAMEMDDDFDSAFEHGKAVGWNAFRAAMLQGADGNSPVIPDCSCRTCRPVTFSDSRFVVCHECGNKRCPHANDHRNACTGSNEPGQEGSAYPAAPQQDVKP